MPIILKNQTKIRVLLVYIMKKLYTYIVFGVLVLFLLDAVEYIRCKKSNYFSSSQL